MEPEDIEVRDLRVRYGSTEILHGINVNIKAGEFVSIVGKSGCGKSTFLMALAGFKEHTGSVRMPGKVGMVFQGYAVFPWLSVRDNIGFGLRDLPQEKRNHQINRLLELVDLKEHADKYPGQLSGGQTQRVAVARSLAPEPRVLFMDEPFGALDMFTRNKLQEWLVRTWEDDPKTVLFVTHSIEEAMFLSSRVLLFDDGRICGDMKVDFERPRSTKLRFAPEFNNFREKIMGALAS